MRDGRELKARTLEFLAALAARSKQLDEAEEFYRRSLKNPRSANLIETNGLPGASWRFLMEAKKYEAVVESAGRA